MKDIISTFRDDRRVWVWDLYNEPPNGDIGDISLPLVKKVFAWTRKINPTQPLTVGTWNGNAELNDIIFSHSDIITFHNYNQADALRNAVTELKKHGRPVINTKWLNRPTGSLVETCLPVFATENVGCMHWGLVNGRTQTLLAWGAQPRRRSLKKIPHQEIATPAF